MIAPPERPGRESATDATVAFAWSARALIVLVTAAIASSNAAEAGAMGGTSIAAPGRLRRGVDIAAGAGDPAAKARSASVAAWVDSWPSRSISSWLVCFVSWTFASDNAAPMRAWSDVSTDPPADPATSAVTASRMGS